MANDKSKLRRLDFRTGILLALLAVAVLWEAASYPMSDSYGGVQNVWYVSPALFPLLVGLLLLILALVLVGNAVAYHGWPGVLRGNREESEDSGSRDLRFFSIVLFFIVFVYAYIPRVDFFIASAFFLFSFIAGYYLDRPRALVINTLFYCIIGAGVLLTSRFAPGPSAQWVADIFTTAGLFILPLILLRECVAGSESRRRLRTILTVSLLVPLVLCPLFRFGLLVPLPTEGTYIGLMEQSRYLLRSLF